MDEVAEQYRVNTLERSTIITSNDPHIMYVKNMFNDLIEQGKIIRRENMTHGKMYRAATGPELLELARKQASLESMLKNANDRAKDQTKTNPEQSLRLASDREK